ncbi:MAG TPA: hypothetical protein VGZ47_05410 [Gemmataceae bacterium]|jgi:hypothetical protein|nr:hypothetical protein [Gemmataceae bacterium]
MWKSGYLALGALLFIAALATADDRDLQRLDLKKSGTIGNSDQFTFEGRAELTDDDVQDVGLRYWLGYTRGANGGTYILPRFYAFRSGFYDGASGAPFSPFFTPFPGLARAAYYNWGGVDPGYGVPAWGGYRSYGFGRGSYYPYASAYYGGYSYPSSYAYYTPGYYYPAPVAYSVPVVQYSHNLPASTSPSAIHSTPTFRMPMNPVDSEPSLAQPRKLAPSTLEGNYPYDGPPKGPMPQVEPPSYRYDGGPSFPVPMPGAGPTNGSPKFDPADGRVVSLSNNKKLSYPAYGEHKKPKVEEGLRTVRGD